MSRAHDPALQRELEMVAHHEAGHVIGDLVLKQPFTHVKLTIHRRWFGPDLVSGMTYLDRGKMVEMPTHPDWAVVLLAGPEAEARWHQLHVGHSRGKSRRKAKSHNTNGDVVMATESIEAASKRNVTGRYRKAQSRAEVLVAHHWDDIAGVAAELAVKLKLTRRQVKRLL